MRFIIGIAMIILGGVLTAVTGIVPFAFIMLVGVFLFASFTAETTIVDYIIANSNEALARKRSHILFLPFVIISKVLTLGHATLTIVWKEQYFKVTQADSPTPNFIKISRKEYIALRNEQRTLYSTRPMSREFMQKAYNIENIGFARKKRRLILAVIFVVLFLTVITMPGGIFIALIYELLCIPMIILWVPEYIDAKILHEAFLKATAQYPPFDCGQYSLL